MATALAGLQPSSTVPQIINHIWHYVSHQINTGHVNNIRLPANFKPVIGQNGFEILTARFQHLIQAPVSIVEDAAAGVIRMVPTRNPEGRVNFEAPEPNTVTGKKAGVKRPPNAFILYRQHYHPIIKNENPDIHNNQISVILGKQWKAESHKTRSHYKTMAEDIKKKHLEDNPEYTYEPRKSTDKKRRMTKKKAAALAEIAGALSSTSKTSNEISKINGDSIPISSNGPKAANSLPQSTDFLEHPLGLEKTDAGNIVITLGDENMDDEQLLDLLSSYNKSLPSPLPATMVRASATPAIIYTERDAESQDENNFFGSMLDWQAIEADIAAQNPILSRLRAQLWDLEHGNARTAARTANFLG
ncbi:hypothetical protein MMC13_002086 [Lambiella insularis]|nr:hypothetical protein [Lambiella insularis]